MAELTQEIIMAEVKLAVAELQLRTCKLTKSILKQLPVCNSWDELRQRLSPHVRSPIQDAELLRIEAKYSTPEGATEDERRVAEGLATLKGFSEYMKEYTVGWIHGSILGDEFTRFLLVQTEPGQYVLYRDPAASTIAKFKQVFVL